MAAVFAVAVRHYAAFCASFYEEVALENIAIFKGKADAQGYYAFGLPQKPRTDAGR